MAADAQIRIRPLRDGETGPIDAVFAGMSVPRRSSSFHGTRPRPTADRCGELSRVDDTGRLVLVAEAVDGGRVTTVGSGRFVATGEDVVAVAVAVADRWHRRGVGRRLLRALRHRAVDAGYRVVVARVMVEDRAAAALLFSVFPGATMRRDGTAYEVVAALPEPVGTVALPLAV